MSPTVHGETVEAVSHQRPDPGMVVRVARTAAGWNQAELGRRCGYSASQVSRWETGRLPLRDTTLLRTLAKILTLHPTVFGLTESDTTERPSPSLTRPSHRVGRVPTPTAEEDPVRRRTFLQLTGLTGPAFTWPDTPASHPAQSDPARVLTHQLGEVLLTPDTPGVEPVGVGVLLDRLAVARGEFTACRYLPLAGRLSGLISAAEATAAEHRAHPAAARILADVYNLATRSLIKLEASGLEWVSADRGLRAARTCEDPLTVAESQRLLASVARRAGDHDRAQTLTLAAADHLDITAAHPAPAHLGMHGLLHCSAGYAAARAGDRDRAHELLTEADITAARLGALDTDPARHRALTANILSHRVSAAYLLGDAGTALAHARAFPLAAIPTTERRARLLVDTALAYAQWDKPARAYTTLLRAERTAPGEVHTRNAARQLVTDLMASPKQAAMPGLPALARRVHALT
jgi:transcriptional regulator with XRE-family HTH domain/tetratricopeptide (TPR) repeat protein